MESGVHVREGGHHLAGVVENSAAQTVFGPGGDRAVALCQIAQAGKGFVAVAARVEEVNRLTAGDAVAGGRYINLGFGLGFPNDE